MPAPDANTDPLWPIQTAVHTLLTADSDLMAVISGVYDHVPEGTGFPYVTIGTFTSTPQGAHDRFGARTTVTLHIWSTYHGRSEVSTVAAHLIRLLDHQTLTVAGHITVLTHLQQQVDVPDPDPDIRHRAVRFAVETEYEDAA